MGWQLLKHAKITGSAGVLDSGTFTAKKHLKVIIAGSVVSGTMAITFNGVSPEDSRYPYKTSDDFASSFGGAGAQPAFPLTNSANFTYCVIEIFNVAGEEKQMISKSLSSATGITNYPVCREGLAKWTESTAQITSVKITNNSGGALNCNVGSYITVLGASGDVVTDEKTTLTNVPVGTRYEETDTKKMYRWAVPTNPEATKNYVYGTSQVPAGANATVSIGDSGTKMYLTSNSASDSQKGYQYTLSTAYDVSTASYASKSYQFGSQSGDTRGMKWKNNGTYCYKISDQTGNKAIYRYTASTAWDISTLGSNQSYTYSSVQTGGKDMDLSSDGTKMYGLADNATIYQYTLSTAWQVSSGVSSASKSFSCQSQDNAPRNFQITNSGTKLRYLGSQYNKLYTYTLSTAWDISTASYDGADSDIDCNTFTDNPYGVWCKDDFSWLAIGSVDSPYDVQQFDKDPVWKVRGSA